MRKILQIIIAVFIPTLSLAGTHVMQNDSITVSSLTITGTGIRFADGTVQVSSAPAGGSGTSGATNASQLYDFAVSRASSTSLSIGPNCSTTYPCNVAINNTVYSFTSGATATISGSGTGTAYVYVAADGTLTVGHNVTVSCSGCTQTAATSFPSNALPLATWTATSGAWDTSGKTEFRSFLSREIYTAGTNITITNNVISSSGSVLSGSTTDYWDIPLAQIDDGNVAKPAGGVYLGSGHNVVASHLFYGSTSYTIDVPLLELADASTGYFQVVRRLPWAPTSIKVEFGITEGNGASGNIRLDARTLCTPFDNSSLIDAWTWNDGTPQTVAMPAFKRSKIVTFSSSGYSTGCAANSLLHVVIYRDPTHSADDYGQTVYVTNVLLTLIH